MQSSLPKHVAIIMDGNGRWAQQRGHSRVFGHAQGAKVAKSIIESCATRGINNLTLFAFSTENWHRPATEVNFLMKLLKRQLAYERQNLVDNNIQFHSIGQVNRLPSSVQKEVNDTIIATRNCTGMKLTFALSFGGRQEITEAAKRFAQDVLEGKVCIEDFREEDFYSYLESSSFPDPDIIIRTSGESRLSNFLLWSSAYSEIFIHEKMWPEFTDEDLDDILLQYMKRNRRFGKTQDQILSLSQQSF
ncbi:MAG: isoprenyl transferase [Bdellovibrionales bacterium]|nr:isoprenyl transferase [Bdellovibrionales bacterium]